jgi:hypothetical protein
MAAWKQVGTILDNPDIPDTVKQTVLQASGASTEDATYFIEAGKDPQVKEQDLLPQIQSTTDHTQLINDLAAMRKMVGGKMVVDDTVITYLNDQGNISDAEAKMLRAYHYDEVNNKFYFSKSYNGGVKKLTYAQAKAIFKGVQLPSALKLGGTQTTSSNATLNTILSKKPTKATFKFK